MARFRQGERCGIGAGETGDKARFWRGGGWEQGCEVGAVEAGDMARLRLGARCGIGAVEAGNKARYRLDVGWGVGSGKAGINKAMQAGEEFFCKK